jgi:hypothetical protein
LIPESVSKVAWEWSAPEGVSVSDVLPVPSGAALVVADGVIVLDGAEGTELWNHREVDTSKPEVTVAAGGEMIVLDFPSSLAGESVLGVRTVVLDSGTGQTLGEYEQADIEGTGQGTIQGYDYTGVLAQETRIRWDTSDGSLHAYDLISGDQVWARDGLLEGHGYEYSSMAGVVAVADAVFSAVVSHDGLGVREGAEGPPELLVSISAIDANNGELLWEQDHKAEGVGPDIHLEAHEDDGSLSFLGVERKWTILDRETGEILLADREEVRGATVLDVRGEGVLHADISTDEESVSYVWSAPDGGVQRQIDAEGRLGERDIVRPVDLGDQLVRLDYLVESTLARGPVTLEALPWDGGPRESLPLEFDLHERLRDNEGSMHADAVRPGLVVVPGAVVISERENGAEHLIGVS